MKNKKGFTLIELLVVIAIIGLLAAIVAVQVNKARSKGRDARRLSDIKNVQTALEMYLDGEGNGSYPVGGASVTFESALGVLVEKGYLQRIPVDPNPASSCNYNGGYGYRYGSGLWDTLTVNAVDGNANPNCKETNTTGYGIEFCLENKPQSEPGAPFQVVSGGSGPWIGGPITGCGGRYCYAICVQ